MRKIVVLFLLLPNFAFSQSFNSFVEYGASVHKGDNNPLWQVSNQHGLSSLDNFTYLRGGGLYVDSCVNWKLNAGLDLVVAEGMSSRFIVQEAYADICYKWMGSLGDDYGESAGSLSNL